MTNSLRQVWDIQDKFADTFRNTHFLCATKNCPPEAVGKIDPKVNLVMKFDGNMIKFIL